MISIILGQYEGQQLKYMGHVTLGVSREAFRKIQSIPTSQTAFFEDKSNDNATWLKPTLVCTVKYMEKTRAGMLRQPVFKGLRDDKRPEECVVTG